MADPLTCPRCRAESLVRAGRTERCVQCDGAWIHEDVLVGILQEAASALVELPWEPRDPAAGGGPCPCAVCGEPMAPVRLGEVALDRCAAHGVWFDSHELAAVLEHAREFKAEPAPAADHRTGLLGLLARLFG